MSKRFGRQQKRKLKNEIRLLTEEVTVLEDHLDYKDQQMVIAEDIINIANRINPNSVVFHPKSTSQHMDRMSIRPDTNLIRISDKDPSVPAKMVDINYIDLYSLKSSLECDKFKNAVHFRTRISNSSLGIINTAGYSFSRDGFMYSDIDKIAMEVADHLKVSWENK